MHNLLKGSDRLWITLDHALWSFYHAMQTPIQKQATSTPSHISGKWMRINYAGEVCAQALLLGAMCTARDENNFKHFASLMRQEYTHLDWCKQRLYDMGEHRPSYNFIWSSTSFIISACNGLRGDVMSWSFIEETEVLVIRHLRESYQELSRTDTLSADIVKKIMQDEIHHAHTAHHHYPLKLRTGWLGWMRPMFTILKRVEQ